MRKLGHAHGIAVARGLAIAIALGVVTTSGPARADGQASEQDIAQARELGKQAQAAFDAGNFAESEKLWAAAQRLYPVAPTITLGLARAQVKLGHFVLAYESYNKIIREWGTNTTGSQPFRDAAEAAKVEINTVSPKIAGVVITVEGPESPRVTIDGQPVPAAALGFKRPVDPGRHLVKAEGPGFKAAEAAFEVSEGGAAQAKLKLEKLPDEPKRASETPSKPEVRKGGSPNKTLAIAAFGVGGAGLVVGAVTGLIAMSKASDLDGKCGPDGNTCPPDTQSDIDGYKTMGTISTIGFIAAGVGLTAGAVLWFTAPKESASASNGFKTASTKGVTLQPYIGPAAAGVTGRF